MMRMKKAPFFSGVPWRYVAYANTEKRSDRLIKFCLSIGKFFFWCAVLFAGLVALLNGHVLPASRNVHQRKKRANKFVYRRNFFLFFVRSI